MPRTQRSDAEWQDIIDQAKAAIRAGLVEPGFSASARFLGIPYQTVQSAFKRLGVSLEDLQREAALSDPGLTDALIDHERKVNQWEINSVHPAIHTVEQLLDYCEVDRSVWMVADGVVLNAWPTTAKNKKVDLRYFTDEDSKGNPKTLKEGTVQSDGELVSKTNLQIKVRLVRIEPVEVIPVIRPVTVGDLKLAKVKGKKSPVLRSLLIADPQFGLSRNVHTGALTPIHDRRVLDIALQIAQAEPFDDITFLGDLLDLSEWSTRWVTAPEFYWTTQPTLIEAHWWLRQFRTAQPGAAIDDIEGNHARFKAAIIARLLAAYELRAVNELELAPAISLPKLLALHELEIGFIEGYDEGTAEKWFSDSIVAIHGDKASNVPGATARKIADEVMFTTIFGHIHRRELVTKKVETRNGPVTYTAVCPGTACRIDAAVPGNKKRQQWQQGIAIMEYSPEDAAPPRFDLIEIHEGRAVYQGGIWQAREMDERMGAFLRAELGKIGNGG